MELINEKQPKTLPDSSEDSITFLDLPREVISQVLRRLPDHVSLLEAAKALKPLEALVDREAKLWETLCRFHFTQEQIDKQKVFFEILIYVCLDSQCNMASCFLPT